MCLEYLVLICVLQFIIQVTCDPYGVITSYEYGWPGSVQDSRVFRLSHLWQNRAEYFRAYEYILVDKGMRLFKLDIREYITN